MPYLDSLLSNRDNHVHNVLKVSSEGKDEYIAPPSGLQNDSFQLFQAEDFLVVYPVLLGIKDLPFHNAVDNTGPNILPMHAILMPRKHLRERPSQEDTHRVSGLGVTWHDRHTAICGKCETSTRPSNHYEI